MEFKKCDNNYVVRLNKGEEIIEQLKILCEKENIKVAEITGIGASNLVEIGVFNPHTKEYKTQIFEGIFEITSVVGNVSRKYNDVYLHIHINFGDENGKVFGGHLVRAKISVTGEIIVRKIEGEIGRKLSEEIGINLLSF